MENSSKPRDRVLGMIPARGGSKGIPKKNLALLAGKPLLGWTAEKALKSELIDEVVVSSESTEIIEVAKSFGVGAPFRRPDDLARDDTLVVDVMAQALEWFADNRGEQFDYIILLQPTAPFALPEDYDCAIRLAYEKNADTVISVSRCGQLHPAIMFTLGEDGRAEWFLRSDNKAGMGRRQDLPPVYVRTGVVYVCRASMVLEKRSLYGDRLYAIEVPEERVLGIDTPLDLKLAEVVLQEQQSGILG